MLVEIETERLCMVELVPMNSAGKFNFLKLAQVKKATYQKNHFELKRQLQLMIKRSGIETKLNMGTG